MLSRDFSAALTLWGFNKVSQCLILITLSINHRYLYRIS